MQNEIVINQIIKEGQVLNVISPGDEKNVNLDVLLNYIEDNNAMLKELLLKHGAVLFRGFNVNGNEDFQNVKEKFSGASNFSYMDGNSPRTKLASNIYTSTEYPKEYAITLHNEMSYSNRWPQFLFFTCQIPSEEGGETPLADCRLILKKLNPDIVNKFREYGVKYTRYLAGSKGMGKSWMSTFDTTDKTVIENYCKENNVEYFWENNNLCLSHKGPGIIKHPVTHEEVWFNQANQFHPSSLPGEVYEYLKSQYSKSKYKYPQYAFYGNGDEIPEEYLKEVTEVHFETALKFKWEKGDLVVLDNLLMAHGRMPFKGERKVLVSMC